MCWPAQASPDRQGARRFNSFIDFRCTMRVLCGDEESHCVVDSDPRNAARSSRLGRRGRRPRKRDRRSCEHRRFGRRCRASATLSIDLGRTCASLRPRRRSVPGASRAGPPSAARHCALARRLDAGGHRAVRIAGASFPARRDGVHDRSRDRGSTLDRPRSRARGLWRLRPGLRRRSATSRFDQQHQHAGGCRQGPRGRSRAGHEYRCADGRQHGRVRAFALRSADSRDDGDASTISTLQRTKRSRR